MRVAIDKVRHRVLPASCPKSIAGSMLAWTFTLATGPLAISVLGLRDIARLVAPSHSQCHQGNTSQDPAGAPGGREGALPLLAGLAGPDTYEQVPPSQTA